MVLRYFSIHAKKLVGRIMEERALTQELDELGAEEGLEVHGSGRPNKKQ